MPNSFCTGVRNDGMILRKHFTYCTKARRKICYAHDKGHHCVSANNMEFIRSNVMKPNHNYVSKVHTLFAKLMHACT